jgi:protein tyrosine/serine phosphatase
VLGEAFRMRIGIVLAAVATVALTAWITIQSLRMRPAWDHFDEVTRGVLYRSGQLTPQELEAAVQKYGMKTVVSFLIPGRSVTAERALAQRMGIDFLDLPMPGDGFGREDQFREVLAACADPERRPVLVHCARGTCRTGAAVALYRFERGGWTIEDVAAEMRRQTYRQGLLPGYVYTMVQDRPFAELFEPRITHDRNLPPQEIRDDP